MLGQFAPGGAACVQQFLPADLRRPQLEHGSAYAALLVVMKFVFDTMFLEPRERAFHGVAVLDAIDRSHMREGVYAGDRFQPNMGRVGIVPPECRPAPPDRTKPDIVAAAIGATEIVARLCSLDMYLPTRRKSALFWRVVQRAPELDPDQIPQGLARPDLLQVILFPTNLV